MIVPQQHDGFLAERFNDVLVESSPPAAGESLRMPSNDIRSSGSGLLLSAQIMQITPEFLLVLRRRITSKYFRQGREDDEMNIHF